MAAPKYLYKFRSFRDKNHKAMLTDRELFLASPDKFNDPFDCSAPIRYEDFTKPEFLSYWTAALKRSHPGVRDYDIRRKVKEFYKRCRSPSGKKLMAQYQEETIKRMRSTDIGVFSLTANFRSILSWSHYADSHRGFCVGFHTMNLEAFIEEQGPSLDLGPVDYTKEYPVINAYKTSDDDKTKKIVWTKSKDWEYEQEYRIIWLNGANQLLRVPDGIIRRVILGCQVDPADKSDMISTLRFCSNRISIFQAERQEHSFGLRFNVIK